MHPARVAVSQSVPCSEQVSERSAFPADAHAHWMHSLVIGLPQQTAGFSLSHIRQLAEL